MQLLNGRNRLNVQKPCRFLLSSSGVTEMVMFSVKSHSPHYGIHGQVVIHGHVFELPKPRPGEGVVDSVWDNRRQKIKFKFGVQLHIYGDASSINIQSTNGLFAKAVHIKPLGQTCTKVEHYSSVNPFFA